MNKFFSTSQALSSLLKKKLMEELLSNRTLFNSALKFTDQEVSMIRFVEAQDSLSPKKSPKSPEKKRNRKKCIKLK